mgnify:CR=1 FL=1
MFKHVEIDLGYTDMIAHTTEDGRVYEHPVERKNYPSITTVLSILSKDSIAKWRARVGEEEANRVSTRASRRGTAVHEALENFVDNEEWSTIKKKYTPDVISSVMGVKDILSDRIGKVYGQELPLYSDHLRVAGRVDCVAEFDGVLSIIDFKTSRKTKRKSWCESYFCQEAAYAIMWEERTGMPITQLVTIIAVDDLNQQGPGSQVFIEKRDNWVPKLRETIDVYYQKRN